MQDGALTWEIDEFLDRDLVLAEVELPDPAAKFALPEWLEPFVVREVTEDPAFQNLNLAL
jgi:CYTH domain-containing protein